MAALSLPVVAAAQEDPVEVPSPAEEALVDGDEPLRVGIAGSAPFVVTRSAGYEGMSIELWSRVAERIRRGYELQHFETVGALLEALVEGDVDVAVGPITIGASRAERVAFSQPYFHGGLAVLSPPLDQSWFGWLAPFLTKHFATGFGILLLVLLGVGTLLWVSERKVNSEQFHSDPLRGILTGIWLALVTMTTVGYGDTAPKTPIGRTVVGIWMLVALISASSLTAFLATALTLSQLDDAELESVEQFQGRPIATVEGSSSVELLREHNARIVPEANLASAVQAVAEGHAEAVVFDRPALHHFMTEHPDLPLTLSAAVQRDESYGFAVRFESPLRNPIDVALLRMQEDGSLTGIRTRWLGAIR